MENKEFSQLMHNVFNTPDGKALLEELVERFIMNKTADTNDPNYMYFSLGQESIIKTFRQMQKHGLDFEDVIDYTAGGYHYE
jgi:hypothetical protein